MKHIAIYLLFIINLSFAGEITVSATANKSLTPDYLEWSLQIKSIQPSLDESQAEVVEQLNSLIKILDELNIAPEDRALSMFQHGKNTYYDNKSRKQVHDGFYSSRQIEFKLRDTKAYTTALKKLLRFQAITIHRVAFKSSKTKETQELLLIKALQQSKIKATKMVSALSMNLGLPLSIHEGVQYNPKSYSLNHNDAFAARSVSADENNSTALKQITVSASVTVVYEMTAK